MLVKVGLIAACSSRLGAVNRRRVIPKLRALADAAAAPGAAGHLLRRTLRAEVALVVVVLGVTAALVSYPPPDSLAGGPFGGSATLGPLRLEATMDPARVGPNELHLYLLRASDGTPFDGTKELTVTLALPGKGIGPLAARAREAGPGHYVVDTRPARARRRLAAARDEPRLGVRPVRHDAEGAGALMRPSLRQGARP